jgi:hypothetical protein
MPAVAAVLNENAGHGIKSQDSYEFIKTKKVNNKAKIADEIRIFLTYCIRVVETEVTLRSLKHECRWKNRKTLLLT